MAGLASKRQRDEAEIEEMKEGEEVKRQKSYNQIVSLLEEEEEEAIEDLSSIMSTLQQEISISISSGSPKQSSEEKGRDRDRDECASNFGSSCCSSMKEMEEEGERERVMRHLLEASDDELGIPNGEFVVGVGEGLDGVALCDALWELEDEAANYYTLFQSQLFM